MDAKALSEYSNWVDKSPAEIVLAVIRVGGWGKVFPKAVPIWAHRLRNFFNEEPISLTRYDADYSGNFVGIIQENYRGARGIKSKYTSRVALSGDVYRDQAGKIWFQMSPAGTIYHWGRDPLPTVVGKMADGWVMNYGKGQGRIPIFKLVSPDGTGGSRETIIRNQYGQSAIGKVNKLEFVVYLINTDYWHQGSYNYSETVSEGLSAHEKRDVEPHEKYPYPEVYFNPSNRFLPLAQRRFPKSDDRGNPFAKMR